MPLLDLYFVSAGLRHLSNSCCLTLPLASQLPDYPDQCKIWIAMNFFLLSKSAKKKLLFHYKIFFSFLTLKITTTNTMWFSFQISIKKIIQLSKILSDPSKWLQLKLLTQMRLWHMREEQQTRGVTFSAVTKT